MTIPHTWENPTQRKQIVTECTVHQEQPPGDEQAKLELGAVWRPFEFTPPMMRSTIGPYMGTPRRSPQPIPVEALRMKSQDAKLKQLRTLAKKANRASTDDEEEKIAVAIFTLLR